MKVSAKVKAFCYFGMNFGVLFFSLVTLIDGASIEKSLFTYCCSAIWINLMLWLGFRLREKGKI